MTADAFLRLFCALRLDARTVARLVAWQSAHVRAGRPVPPEHLHVTLAFLGRRPAADVPAVAAELRAAAAVAGPIVLEPSRYRETRSVGMVALADASGAAAALAADLARRLERRRLYRPEARPWLAHVTVVRFRERPRLDPPTPDLGRFSPSDAAVYSSVLRSDGAQYEVLETVALGGR